MADARIVEVALAVVDLLASNIDPDEAIPESVFVTNEKLKKLSEAGDEPPKKVRVYPSRYYQSSRAARKRTENGYGIQVITEFLYKEPASSDPSGRVPTDWVREQIYWHEQKVYALLNETGVHLDETETILGELRPETCETVVIYDETRLDVEKLFLSVTEVEYREIVRG